jgi:hypothetical protein
MYSLILIAAYYQAGIHIREVTGFVDRDFAERARDAILQTHTLEKLHYQLQVTVVCKSLVISSS